MMTETALRIQLALHMTLSEWEEFQQLLIKNTNNVFHMNMGHQLEQVLEMIRADFAERELAAIMHSENSTQKLH